MIKTYTCKQCGNEFRAKDKGNHPWCSRYCRGLYERNTSQKFWNKVRILKDKDDCWLWKAGCFGSGYGAFWWKGNNRRSHRVAYELTYGPVPEDIGILHSCDTPRCCNPNHLFKGTQKDNMRDMIQKGRRGKCGMPTGHRYSQKPS